MLRRGPAADHDGMATEHAGDIDRKRWPANAVKVIYVGAASSLVGIDTPDTLTRVALPVVATRIYAVVVWLIGLTAVVLLWRRSSSAFFGETEAHTPIRRGTA